jgi:phosphoheptose isomerase
VVSLAADTATLSATVNDRGYERVAADRIAHFADPEDVLIGVSTSGESANVLETMARARQRGLTVLALIGSGASASAARSDLFILVPGSNPGVVEDASLVIKHAVAEQLCSSSRGPGAPTFHVDAAGCGSC